MDVVGLGELLWDCFPDRKLPGGAPANVAFHAQQLGLSAAVATRVGVDSLGDELLTFLQQQGLSTSLVQRDPHHGTGTVTVEPRESKTAYTFLENSAWDFLALEEAWLTAMRQARAVCFGTLAQRNVVSRRTIHECVAATSPECLRVYDINLRPPFYDREWIDQSLRLARIVKLNNEEVPVVAAMCAAPRDDELQFADWLRKAYDLELVCITRGANGAAAVTASEQCETPGIAIEVADTVGAGDAFTAALIWTRIQRWPLARSIAVATRVGALVASRPGAMPVLGTDLQLVLSEI